ncbi:MAG: DUF366 family protein [Heliobacteriaceae bacterium]|jgi:hypothetical protein|nr:DUF366 family protein [Heliobacteriaceae bacterium]
MKTRFLEQEIKYDGTQLAPHWIYRNFRIQGDAVAAFKGECEVKLAEMVDIEDVLNNEPIYSKSMLHFISEQFNTGLAEGVFRQRLLICIIKEALEKRGVAVQRRGDDLFVNSKKLTVSIATKSLTSVLIHTGINIDADGAPVAAAGLTSDLGINDIEALAKEIMICYSDEIDDIILATTKVNGLWK